MEDPPGRGRFGLRLDGAIVPLLDHPDSVVVIEFWARWCAPCRATLATAARLDRWARAAGLPVRVLLVNTQESFSSGRDARRQIEDYLAKVGNTMQTLLDPESRLHLALGGGLPRTVVIDRSGRVAGSHTGYDPDLGPKLESQILELTSGGSR